MAIMPTMLRLSLAFSHNNILVQSMRMSTIQCYLKYYKYRTLLPLYIVTLKTHLDLMEFVKFARDFEMSLNLWLVFIYRSKELLRYCAHPHRNLFNVKYDTKMLVKCENDTMVREWYSLRRDEVRVNDLATWSMDDGFVKVTNRSLWERRNTLDGITIRIATVKVYISSFYCSRKNDIKCFFFFLRNPYLQQQILNVGVVQCTDYLVVHYENSPK